MLRRTKIIIAGYVIGGLLVLALALGLIFQFTNWFSHPEQFEGHGHHHHGGEEQPQGPDVSPAETYTLDGKTYLRAPFLEKDFDVTQSSVELSQIFQVKLNQDNFPLLDELKFVPAAESTLPDDDTVLGVSIEGESKAYPIRMLNFHIVFNDTCGGKEIAAVWDPLTMSPKAFHRVIEQAGAPPEPLSFALLGLLYEGGLLLYDQGTSSIWWPPEGKCIAGRLNGARLEDYAFLLSPWRVWRARHPATQVLSTQTPHSQLYGKKFYGEYYALPELTIPVEGWDPQKSPLKWSEPVIVLQADGRMKGYPVSVLATFKEPVEDEFGGRKILFPEPQARPPFPTDAEGRELRYSFGAWFLWSIRYPQIQVFSPARQPSGATPAEPTSALPGSSGAEA